MLPEPRPDDENVCSRATDGGFHMSTFTVKLSSHTLDALNKMLSEMTAGNALEIVPLHAKLTTQDAANFLNVSRPYLVKLLEDGELPCRKFGRDRRVLFADLMIFKQQREQQSLEAMQALADQGQDLGAY